MRLNILHLLCDKLTNCQFSIVQHFGSSSFYLLRPHAFLLVDFCIHFCWYKENEEELKSLSMRVKESSEKASLKLKKTKIIASDPITAWQIEGIKWKQ